MSPQLVNGIYLPDNDTHFAEALKTAPLVDGRATYQLRKINEVLPFVRNKRVAIDVGAHVGLWTRILAKHFDVVHAFEMYHMHHECLELNCGGFANVVLHPPVALGAGHGTADFQVEHTNSGNTRVCPSDMPGALQAPLVPLSDYFDVGDTVDFIKFDVEGYEMQVVIGATELIKRCKPVMVVEQKPGHAERYGCRTGEVLDLLKGWGARIQWQRAGDFCLTWG